ncbi:MAG: ChaN family lipoprotein [Desulfobacterales bacterium]
MPSRTATPAAAVAPGTIMDARTGAPLTFEQMLSEARSARVVFVGEQHTSAAHHAVQLRVIRALQAGGARLAVGMEMFDRSYQPVLDLWSQGALEEEEFLRRTHWYANWRFDYALYREILAFVRSEGIPLVALNVPFNIPPKIRVGGIDTLSAYEKSFLPHEIDTSVASHREFAEKIFAQHRFKNTRFDDFYMAQCVWDEAMAEAAAACMPTGQMVILAGNGHIQYKYGIPERLHRRTGLAYRTIYPVSAGAPIDLSIGDYLWVTE